MIDNVAATVAIWLVVALAIYRVQRIVTTDTWPPSNWFREKVKERFGKDSSWAEFVTCPWCLGTWTTVILGSLTHAHVVNLTTGYLIRPYLFPLYVIVAMSAIVGLLGSRD